MLNILLSSYDFDEPWAQDMMCQIIQSNMRVCVVPFSFDENEVNTPEAFDAYFGIDGMCTPEICHAFFSYGIDVEQIEFVDYFRDDIERVKEKIMQADIILLTGGLPDQLYQRLMEFDLCELLHSLDRIIMGVSAGAMVQLDVYHITPDDDYPIYQYQEGLGLVNGFEIEVHYCASKLQEDGIHRVVEERGLPTYVIGNDGGLIVDEDRDILLFGNAKQVAE